MALEINITFKGLKAPKAYAMVQSFYTKKTEDGYETTAYLKVFDTSKKENELYCEEEKVEGENTVESIYKALKKNTKWKKSKDV